MKFDEIRHHCPECGGLTVTVFSTRPPNRLVADNRCPAGHYEFVGEIEPRAVGASNKGKQEPRAGGADASA